MVAMWWPTVKVRVRNKVGLRVRVGFIIRVRVWGAIAVIPCKTYMRHVCDIHGLYIHYICVMYKVYVDIYVTIHLSLIHI